MTMTEGYTNAALAMAAAHSMRPQLQAVARVVTGNPKITIEFDGKGSRTDAKNRIWLTPPGDLGRFRTHQRSECSRYDDRGFSLCQSCREEEAFFSTALHECSHISYGTGNAPSTVHLLEIMAVWIERRARREFKTEAEHDKIGAMRHFDDSQVAHWVENWKNNYGTYEWDRFIDGKPIRDGYMAAAYVISPWLPVLFNAIEDSRVNRMLHSHRPGTTRMFEAHTRAIMEDGIIDLDGNPVHWKDRDLDSQLLIGALLITSGYEFDFRSCLLPEATSIFDEDEYLSVLLAAVEHADGVEAIFDTARAVLKRLQELGHCLDPEGEGEGEGADGDDGEDGEEAGDGGGGLGGSGTAKTTSGGETKGSDPGEDKGDATKKAKEAFVMVKIISGHEDEIERDVNELSDSDEDIDPDEVGVNPEEAPKWDGEDKDIDIASVHFEYFDEPPAGIVDVAEYRFSEGGKPTGTFKRMMDQYKDEYMEGYWDIPELEGVRWAAAQHLPVMRKIFSENRAVRTTRHLKAGRLDSMTLGRKLKTGRDDVFRKREQPDTRSYAVVIGLDISGSTSTGVLKPMKAAAFAQAEMLHKANIPFEFNCHTGNRIYSGDHPGMALEIIKIKDWGETWGPEQLKRLQAIVPGSCNLDGHTFEYYRKSVEARREDVGLVLYFTDGAMPAENYHEELEILEREVKHIKRRKNLEMLAIGVGNTEPEKYGLEMVRYDSLSDLPALLKALEKKLTHR